EYEATIEKLEDGTYKITNKHTPGKVNVEGIKEWADADDRNGKRPDKVTIILKADGTEIDTTEATVDSNWAWAFIDLPKYKFTVNADGSATKTEIVYTVDESAVPEYETTIEKLEDGTYKITNTHEPELTEATVKKIWDDAENKDGFRPPELVVELMNGNTVVETVTLKAENGWTVTVKNLPKFANGVEINYTWAEKNVPDGYTLDGTVKDGTVTSIVNIHTTELIDVTVIKIWDDENDKYKKRPVSLVVKLSNGTEVTLTAENNWTATVKGLPKYENGKEISYTWTEENVPAGYKLVSIVTEGYVTTITNFYRENPHTYDHGIFAPAAAAVIGILGALVVRRKKFTIYEEGEGEDA
ncbi:MAG: Cna B-type domain-containing protein, partial [Clostridia bacterium]|nr:Cna B-type domain-containing protein [Clostridia bacterium]